MLWKSGLAPWGLLLVSSACNLGSHIAQIASVASLLLCSHDSRKAGPAITSNRACGSIRGGGGDSTRTLSRGSTVTPGSTRTHGSTRGGGEACGRKRGGRSSGTRGCGAGIANSTREGGDDATAASDDFAGIDKALPAAAFDSTREGGNASGRKRCGRFRSGHTQADVSPRGFARGAVAEAG